MHLWRTHYVVRDARGRIFSREKDFYLPDEDAVRAAVLAENGWLVRTRRRTIPWWRRFTRHGRDLAIHILQSIAFQATTTAPGVALSRTALTERNPHRRMRLMPAHTVIQYGGTFIDALRALGLYDPVTIAMIAAGERSRSLRDAIVQAVEQIQTSGETIKRNVAILSAVALDLIIVITSLLGNNSLFKPILSGQANAMRDPAMKQRFLDGVAAATLFNEVLIWLTLALTGAGMALAVMYWRNRTEINHWAIRVVQAVPLLKGYWEDIAMASSWMVFSRLMRANVSATEAITIVSETAFMARVRSYWLRVRDGLLSEEPSQALAQAPLENIEQMQVLNAKTTQDLSMIADTIATRRNARSQVRQKRMVKWLFLGSIIYILAGFSSFAYMVWLQQKAGQAVFDTIRSGSGM